MAENDRHTTRLAELAEPLRKYCKRHRLDASHVVRNAIRMVLGIEPVEPVAKEKKKPSYK